MSFWEKTEINFGSMRKNSSKIFTFKALPGMPEITGLQAQCGCTKPKFDDKTKQLQVVYKAGEIPRQLGTNAQPVTKEITVIYKDGSYEILKLKGIKTH